MGVGHTTLTSGGNPRRGGWKRIGIEDGERKSRNRKEWYEGKRARGAGALMKNCQPRRTQEAKGGGGGVVCGW